MRASRAIVIAVFVLVVLGLLIAYRPSSHSRTEIRTRYAELQTALTSTDTNAVFALIAPEYRSTFDGGRFLRLQGIARPLGAHSKILILGSDATVWPSPNWYLCGVWPIGDTVEMTKVAGRWFFTGKVHLD
jgi:hypothetical protein